MTIPQREGKEIKPHTVKVKTELNGVHITVIDCPFEEENKSLLALLKSAHEIIVRFNSQFDESDYQAKEWLASYWKIKAE